MDLHNQPFVGTIGLKIEVEVNFDISSGDLFEIHYKKPNGVYGSFTATYAYVVDKHTMFYITTNSNDIDVPGQWVIQAYVEMGPNRFWGSKDKTERFQNSLS